MISNLDILKYTAKQIKKTLINNNLSDDFKIFIDSNLLQKYKDINCIFISVDPIYSTPCGINTNVEDLIINIDLYLQNDQDKNILYKINKILKSSFARSLCVDKSYLHINALLENYSKDEIGWKSHIELHTKFVNTLFESAYEKDLKKKELKHIEILDEVEKMKDVEIN